MQNGLRALGIILALTLAFTISSAQADTIALTFTGGKAYQYVTSPIPNTIGWEFTLSAPVTVTQLGFYEVFAPLLSSHPVAIWDTETHQKLVHGVVTPSDPLSQGFLWASISPVKLAAGTYCIGALVAAGDQSTWDWYYSGTASRTTASPVTYDGGVYHLGAFAYPEAIGYTNYGRFGPDFQFSFSAVPIPVPGTAWLLGSGLLGLLGLKRKFFG